ncbi:MAG: hypothetical protein K0S97_2147 [Chloroflexota bacterium]|nr:hypothetical protein [Chloroflexota bacterium]
MDDRRGDDQPTEFSEAEPTGARASEPALDPPSELAADAGALDLPFEIARRTGVLFVHGIGTQPPAETFLDWSAPVVELLTDWRAARDGAPAAAPASSDRIDDPVWRAEFSLAAASPPYLEIVVPSHGGIPETTWVVTEAWWASDLRAPSLGRVIDYLRRRMRIVVSGIAQGYRSRAPHLRGLAADRNLLDSEQPPLRWRLIEELDHVQSRAFGAKPVGWLVGGLGAVVLAGYDLLRRVPIPVIQEFAARRMLDSFLVEWFGDLPVLLDEPVQSANVRARVARSIELMLEDECDAIVIVAHSGGALVTFEMLLDPAYAHLRVDKLITLGQGLGLAWRLAADPDVQEITPGHRLVGNLARARPGLRWVDFWASYDPAPAGPLPARGGLTASAVEDRAADGGARAGAAVDPAAAAGAPGDPTAPAVDPAAAAHVDPAMAAVVQTADAGAPWLLRANVGTSGATMAGLATEAELDPTAPTIVVESRPITNEMNVLTDHGTYWANPEGFLVPLVRHVDAALGDASASRFFRNDADRIRRVLWRRERVAALASWGWLCAFGVSITAAILIVLQVGGDQRLTRAGDGIAAVWGALPGHELITVPIEAAASVVGALLSTIGLEALALRLASLGPPLLGLGLLLVLFFMLAKVGLGRWHDWDRRERRAMHPETPALPDRSPAAGQAFLLVAGLVGLILATFGAGGASAIVIVLGAAAGLLIWVSRPFRAQAARAEPA